MTWFLAVAHGKGLLASVASCKGAAKEAPTITVVKQWHLPPKTITKGFKEKYPQEKNQSAIYLALADQIKSKKLDLVIAEGCEGEIKDDFATAFNGWDLDALKKIAQTKGFDRILTHVPLKLEARFGDKLTTVCGDNEKLIQEGNLRLSNLRGWAGYYGKLSEPKADPEKIRPFAEAAAELLKEKKDAPVEVLLPKIRERLSAELDLFAKSLAERNDSFVKAVQSAGEFKGAAIVIGGLHVDDLKTKLQTAGFNCNIMEPTGYAREDEALIKEFQNTLK